jgi:hypothetical protein
VKRSDAAAIVLLVAALGLTWIPRLRGPIDLRWDGATYYILGTSLAAGQGYSFVNEPGNLSAVVWPPMLPALVALHQKTLGSADPLVVGRALRWSFALLWVFYLAVTYFWLRSLGSLLFGLAGTVLVGLNMSTIWLSDRLYADLPFALAVTTFMLVATRKPGRDGPAWVAASVAYLLRTAGVAVLVAWIVEAAFGQRWRVAIQRLILASIPILAWQSYIHVVEHQPSYNDPPYAYARADYALYNVSYARNMMLRDPTHPAKGRASVPELPGRMAGNLTTAVSHLGEATSVTERDWSTIMIAIKQRPVVGRLVPWRLIPISLALFGILVCGGAVVYWAGGRRLIPLVLLAYIMLLALLPTDYHWPRYLAGVAPLVCACFLCGARTMGLAAFAKKAPVQALLSRSLAVAPVVLALALQAAVAGWYFRSDLRQVTHAWDAGPVGYQLFTYDRAFSAFDDGLEWLRAHARTGDVVISSMPHWVYVRTHLRAVMPPFESDADAARAMIGTVGARFVVVDRSGFSPTQEYALPALTASPSEWRAIYRDAAGLLEIYESTAGRADPGPAGIGAVN